MLHTAQPGVKFNFSASDWGIDKVIQHPTANCKYQELEAVQIARALNTALAAEINLGVRSPAAVEEVMTVVLKSFFVHRPPVLQFLKKVLSASY